MRSILTSAAPSVLVLLVLTAGAPAQVQLFELTAPDGAAGDVFGSDVAVEGDLIVVGAQHHDHLAPDAGAAYLFDAATGQRLLELTASDAEAGDRFGCSVAVQDGWILVGAHGDDDRGSGAGAVYVFDLSGVQLAKLTAADGEAEDFFGISLDLSGGRALVGANGDDDHGSRSGAAYVFDLATGQQLFKLTASDGELDDHFGGDVALDGDHAVIGAALEDELGDAAGAAYLFDAGTGQQVHKLTASDGVLGDFFGRAVGIDAGRVVVGSYRNNEVAPDSGAAYVFDASTGQELRKLTATDGHFLSWLGVSVAVHGDQALVGALLDDGHEGAAYVFDLETGDERSKLTAADGKFGDRLGSSVALRPGLAVAAATLDDELGDASGSAYVFALGAPIGTAYCGPAVPNSSGGPASISAFGFTQVAYDQVTLTTRGMPASEFGYFLNGPTQGFVANPGGSQGNLCLTGTVGRHAADVFDSGPSGVGALEPDLDDLPFPGGGHAIVAGETWNWTTWFRDHHPCPTSNFSDGVSITFR